MDDTEEYEKVLFKKAKPHLELPPTSDGEGGLNSAIDNREKDRERVNKAIQKAEVEKREREFILGMRYRFTCKDIEEAFHEAFLDDTERAKEEQLRAFVGKELNRTINNEDDE